MPTIKIQTARQRFKRIPKLDPVTGEQVKVQVNRQRRKGDRPIFKPLTENDRSQPLPNRKCERCGVELRVGQKYRSCAIKTQYGGHARFRCIECPSWLPWEYSSSLSARIMQIQSEEVDCSDWTTEEEATDRAEELAGMVEELADEKEESGQNIEDGFGHEVEASTELKDQAEQLREWAEQVRSSVSDSGVDFPDADPGDCDDPDCGLDHDHQPSEEQLDDWRESAAQAIRDALDNSPL